MDAFRAGELDRRVTLLKIEGGSDDGYTDQPRYVPHRTVWGSVKAAPGKERLASAELAASALTVFRIRWASDLDPATATGVGPTWRIEYPAGSGRYWDIQSVVEMGRRLGIEIAAIRGAD